MSNRTDAEWQALDARIAREVMGWIKWDEIPQAERDAVPEVTGGRWDYLKHGFSSDEYETLRKEGRCAFWWKHSKFGWVHAQEIRDWQSHKNVAQPMLALRTLLVKIGSNAEARLFMRPLPGRCRVTIQNWVATGGVPAMLVRSPHVSNEMHAICLAIEACLNTQGMPDWAAP